MFSIWMLILAGGSLAPNQVRFWDNLKALCDARGQGEIRINRTGRIFDAPYFHVQQCDSNRVAIAFHLGEDRSRTWILTRTDQGLRLKHDHRHEDGRLHEVTDYGGDTREAGTATRQQFFVDAYTIDLVPGTEKNIWVFQLEPGKRLTYELYKGEAEPVFRVTFPLSQN